MSFTITRSILLQLLFIYNAFSSQMLDLAINHEEYPSGKTYTWDTLAQYLDSDPSTFTLFSRMLVETSNSTDSISHTFDSFVGVEDSNISFELEYLRYHKNDPGFLQSGAIFLGELPEGHLSLSRKRQEFAYICFDFINQQTLDNGHSSYDLQIKAFVNWSFSILQTIHIQSIANLSLTLRPQSNGSNTLRFSHVELRTNTLSEDILNIDYKLTQVLLYQIIFYQEPALSLFLYNRSEFTFPPAFSGDIQSKQYQLHSFYCSKNKRSFWMGLAKGEPNYLSLPRDLLRSFDSKRVSLLLLVDFINYGEHQPAFDDTGYTLLSIEDETGRNVAELKHFLVESNYDPPYSYDFSVRFYVEGTLRLSKDFASNDFHFDQKNIFKISIQKTVTNSCDFGVSIQQGPYSEFSDLGTVQTSLNYSDLGSVIIGHKHAPFNESQLAFSFVSLHLSENDSSVSEGMIYYAYQKNRLSPIFSIDTFDFLWIPLEDPVLKKEYFSKDLDLSSILMYNARECPGNCEVCRDITRCLVCEVGYRLSEFSLCEVIKSPSALNYCSSCRDYLYGHFSTISSSKDSLHNTYHGNESFDFAILNLNYSYKCNINVSPSNPSCKCFTSIGGLLDFHIFWKYVDGYPGFFFDFQQSPSNYSRQIIRSNDSKYGSVSNDRCDMTSVSVVYFDPNCSTAAPLSSLRGSFYLHFCGHGFLDITNNPEMLSLSTEPLEYEYTYQMLIPGSSITLYGKCRNNCVCWDGDINTTKGYNSCFPDPVTNQKCKFGYRLHMYSGNGLFEECVKAFDCDSPCLLCEGPMCTYCENEKLNGNFMSVFSDHRFCGECPQDCLSCSSPESCTCNKNQFGPNSTLFDANFDLCRNKDTCTLNCTKCDTNKCIECEKNYVLDSIQNQCIRVNMVPCLVEDAESNCLMCNRKSFLNPNGGRQSCSSNCLHCKSKRMCFNCSNVYKLSNGSCINYSPFLQKNFTSIGSSLVDLGKEKSKNSDYHTKQYFYFEKIDAILSSSVFEEIKSCSVLIENERQLYQFLQRFIIKKCKSSTKDYCLGNNKNMSNTLTQQTLESEFTSNEVSRCIELKRKHICNRCKAQMFLKKLTQRCEPIQNIFVQEVRFQRYTQTNTPSKCVPKFHLDIKTRKCVPQITNCKKMTHNKCTQCATGFFRSPSQRFCHKCPTNCLECTSSSFCTKCVKSFYLFFDYKLEQNQCLPCASSCTDCLSFDYCLECSSPFILKKITPIKKVCRMPCDSQTEYEYRSSCNHCNHCEFCQVYGQVQCPSCLKCQDQCHFKISAQIDLFTEKPSSSFLIETSDWIIHHPFLRISANGLEFEINTISDNLFRVNYNQEIKDPFDVVIPFDSKHISTRTCIARENFFLKLRFDKNQKTFNSMSLSFLKALVNALEMFAVAMQIKYKSFYFMIEFLNINKLFFYLFVLDFFNSGFIKCVNDFTRSHNHKNLNWIVSYFFNLHDPQNLHEYKTISSSIRSSINENRIEAKEILNPKEVLLFF